MPPTCYVLCSEVLPQRLLQPDMHLLLGGGGGEILHLEPANKTVQMWPSCLYSGQESLELRVIMQEVPANQMHLKMEYLLATCYVPVSVCPLQ